MPTIVTDPESGEVVSVTNTMEEMAAAGYDTTRFKLGPDGKPLAPTWGNKRIETPAGSTQQAVPTLPAGLKTADGKVTGGSTDPERRTYEKGAVGESVPLDYQGTLNTALDFTKITDPKVQYVLYNGSEEVVRQLHNSREYVIPPYNTVAYPGLGPGECPVYEGLETMDDKTGRRFNRPIPAIHIIHFLVGYDGRTGELGKRGIRVLFPEGDLRNEAVKEESRRVSIEHKYNTCKQIVSAHESRTDKQREHKIPITPPGAEVRKAYQFIQWYEGEFGGGAVPLSTFPCPKCAWPHSDINDRNAHITAMHKEFAAELGLLAKAGEPTPSADELIERTKRANAAMAVQQGAKAAGLAPVPESVTARRKRRRRSRSGNRAKAPSPTPAAPATGEASTEV